MYVCMAGSKLTKQTSKAERNPFKTLIFSKKNSHFDNIFFFCKTRGTSVCKHKKRFLLLALDSSEHLRRKHLLVSAFEVTSVMATILKQQGHVNVTLQLPTTHVHHLSGWLPFHSLLLHNWTIGRKAHPIEHNLIFKTARFRQADERRARFTIKCTRLCEDTKNILSNLYMYCINKR